LVKNEVFEGSMVSAHTSLFHREGRRATDGFKFHDLGFMSDGSWLT